MGNCGKYLVRSNLRSLAMTLSATKTLGDCFAVTRSADSLIREANSADLALAFSLANSAKGRSLIGSNANSAQRTTAKQKVSFQKLRLNMVDFLKFEGVDTRHRRNL